MDIEGLSKTQMVLLTLLVSFVTSIATGIATVSLYDQAPSKVTRVVNRVVERTVETVSPASPSVVTKEETVVVRDDELITESITSVSLGIVRVMDGETPVGIATVLLDGVGVTSSAVVARDSGTINVQGPSGTAQQVEIIGTSENGRWVFFSIPAELSVLPVTLGVAQNLSLGSTVLVVGGVSQLRAETGIVTEFDTSQGEGGTTAIRAFHTNVPSGILTPGTPVANIFGELVGIVGNEPAGAVVPVGVVRSEYETLTR